MKTDASVSSNKTPATENTELLKSASASTISDSTEHAQSPIHSSAYTKKSTGAAVDTEPMTIKVPISRTTEPLKSTSASTSSHTIDQSVATDGSQSSHITKPHAQRQTYVSANGEKYKSTVAATDPKMPKMPESTQTNPTKFTSASMTSNDEEKSLSADVSQSSHHDKHAQSQSCVSANAKKSTSTAAADEQMVVTKSTSAQNTLKSEIFIYKGKHLSIVEDDAEMNNMLKEMKRDYRCSLCSMSTITYRKVLEKHVKGVHFNHYVQYKCRKSLLCKLNCTSENPGGGHYHCPHCNKLYLKKHNLKCHIESLRKSEIKKTSSLVQISSKKTEACKVCNKQYQPKHMKKHMRTHDKKPKGRINEESHHDGVLISRESGLYMIAKSIRGNQYPLHVKKRVADMHQTLECEDPYCRAGYGMAARSNHVTKSCPHIQSTQFIADTENTKNLHEQYLHDLISQRRISKERFDEMKTRNNEARASHQPAVAVFFPNGEDGRTFYLSVYTGVKESYCRLQRTIISVDTVQDRWTCGCERHKLKRGCGHKSLAKWFLYEHYPDKLKTVNEAEVNDGANGGVIDMTL